MILNVKHVRVVALVDRVCRCKEGVVATAAIARHARARVHRLLPTTTARPPSSHPSRLLLIPLLPSSHPSGSFIPCDDILLFRLLFYEASGRLRNMHMCKCMYACIYMNVCMSVSLTSIYARCMYTCASQSLCSPTAKRPNLILLPRHWQRASSKVV